MKRLYTAILATALLAGLTVGAAPTQDLGKKAASIVKANSPSIVTVRTVLDLEFSGQTQEHKVNSRGVVVADTGLIMSALTTVKPNVNVRMRGRLVEHKVTPADIKVIFEKDEKEYDAFVVVKDTKRGFVFLQIKDFKPTDRKIKPLDFSKSAAPVIGEQLVTVQRLSKGFDYATFFSVARVIGKIKKPRKAHLLDRGSLVGLPIFNLNGKLIGCHAVMRSGIQESKTPTPRGTPVVLAAKEVNGVIKQAVKKAAEGESEEEEEDEKKEDPDK